MHHILHINPVKTPVTGNKMIVNNDVFEQLVDTINTQTSVINKLIDNFNNLTQSVKLLENTVSSHHKYHVQVENSVIEHTNTAIEKLTREVNTLAKSFATYLGDRQ